MARLVCSMKQLIVILVIVLSTLNSVNSQRPPTISYISEKQIKDIGETVDFVCSVKYSQDYPVLWMKLNKNREDRLPISANTALIIRDSRFALRSDPSSSTYTLQIKDVQERDAGFYLCQILISTSSRISAEVELQIRRLPIISDNSTRSLVVTEGQPIQLECYADGSPVPKISWRRENNAILPTGGSIYQGNTLKIASVHKEDRGTYYCVAENGVGHGARRNINLVIEFAPVITTPKFRIGQALQYDVDLKCQIEAYPPPVIITWHKNEEQLSNNQHYSISSLVTTDASYNTTLRVINIEKEQYGSYVCKAANKLGTAETRVELFETVTLACPPACTQPNHTASVVQANSGNDSTTAAVTTTRTVTASVLPHPIPRLSFAKFINEVWNRVGF